jgi:hypothetical protein
MALSPPPVRGSAIDTIKDVLWSDLKVLRI